MEKYGPTMDGDEWKGWRVDEKPRRRTINQIPYKTSWLAYRPTKHSNWCLAAQIRRGRPRKRRCKM